MSCKTELLLARHNGTWDTEVFEHPQDKDPVEWFHETLGGRDPKYADVVLSAVYYEVPEEEDGD